MRCGYFNRNGGIIITGSSDKGGPPPGTVYTATIKDDQKANAIYYDRSAGRVKSRKTFDLVISRNRIEGIPTGTVACVSGQLITITDGCIEFDADVEESIHVHLAHEHYISLGVEVETGT